MKKIKRKSKQKKEKCWRIRSVEESRLFVEEPNAKLNLENTAQLLDAEREQDKSENEGVEDDKSCCIGIKKYKKKAHREVKPHCTNQYIC